MQNDTKHTEMLKLKRAFLSVFLVSAVNGCFGGSRGSCWVLLLCPKPETNERFVIQRYSWAQLYKSSCQWKWHDDIFLAFLKIIIETLISFCYQAALDNAVSGYSGCGQWVQTVFPGPEADPDESTPSPLLGKPAGWIWGNSCKKSLLQEGLHFLFHQFESDVLFHAAQILQTNIGGNLSSIKQMRHRGSEMLCYFPKIAQAQSQHLTLPHHTTIPIHCTTSQGIPAAASTTPAACVQLTFYLKKPQRLLALEETLWEA